MRGRLTRDSHAEGFTAGRRTDSQSMVRVGDVVVLGIQANDARRSVQFPSEGTLHEFNERTGPATRRRPRLLAARDAHPRRFPRSTIL